MDIYVLPKIIWSHWDNINTIPKETRKFINNNKNILKEWQYNFITDNEIFDYLDVSELPNNYHTLGKAHKADWLRLALLKKYGGCWIDSGILINDADEFNKMYNDSVKIKSEFTGFYLPVDSEPREYIENWFIMAPLNSEIIKLWYEEFVYAITIGFKEYKKLVHETIDVVDNIYNKNDPNGVYLTQHACMQMVLKVRLKRSANIILYNADDTMLKIQSLCNWRLVCIGNNFIFNNILTLPYIKLRGSDRYALMLFDCFKYIIIICIFFLLLRIMFLKNQR